MQGVVGFLITTLLQIYQGIFQWKNCQNQLRFDRIMAVSLWSHFLAHPVDGRESNYLATSEVWRNTTT